MRDSNGKNSVFESQSETPWSSMPKRMGWALFLAFFLWVFGVLFVWPPSEELAGESMAEEFVAQLDRDSPGARQLVDAESVIIDEDLNTIQDLRTGYRSRVSSLVSSCRGHETTVLSNLDNCLVSQIAGTVFVVDGEPRIVAITDIETYGIMTPESLEKLCSP